VKTWRLKNTHLHLESNYSIVFDEEDSMGAPASSSRYQRRVEPGEEVDVSVSMTAPEETGEYEGFWKLRNQAGQVFGLGQTGDKQFWVKIEVGEGDGEEAASGTYDFIAQASSAEWIASGGGRDVKLEFGGEDDDPDGVAKREWHHLEVAPAGQTLSPVSCRLMTAGSRGLSRSSKFSRTTASPAKLASCKTAASAGVFQPWVEQGDNLGWSRIGKKNAMAA
jgi:hypothetical protein